MNPYIPLHFLAAFSYLCLGFYSHLQDRKAQANRVFLVLCLVTALWAFCVGCVLLSPTQREADFWYFLSAPGWCFAPGLVLRFSVALIQQNRPSSWFWALPFYLPGIVFLGQSILDFALHGAIVSFSFPLPWDLAYTAYYVIGLASSILLVWRWGLQTKIKRERRQAMILGTTLAVGLMLILLNETVLPDLGVVFIPRIPAVLMLVWAIGIFYAITRYRLMQLTPALTASWITSQVSDLLFLINPENCILQINAKAAKTLGYGEKELLHQSFDVLLPSEQQGFLLQQRVDTPPEISRVILRSKAGTSIPVHVHITPFYDPAGDRLGTLFIAQDLRPLIDLETQIAEREQAEEILKQSESLYRTLAEAAQDIVFIIDESDIIHYVNNFAAQMIGKTTKGLVGQKQAALFPPEIAVVQSEHVRQVLFTGEPQYIVTHGNFPQGEMWLGTWLVPARVDNGTVPAVMGVSRNITDEKINQERLQELLESYQKLFEAFPYGAMLITFSGTPVLMNRRMEEVLAKPRQLLWREMGPKDVYPEISHREELLRVIEQNGGRVENYPMTYRRLNGETFPAEISVETVQYLGHNLRLVCLQDVTERKQVEEALQESKERLELALIGGNLGFYDWDLQTGRGYTDERYLGMLGYTPGEIDLGWRANWEQQVHPDDLGFANYLIQSDLRGETVPYDEEYRMRHKSGEWVWVRDRAQITARGADGRPLRLTGLHEDITERKRAEAALRESEERFRQIFQSATDCIFIKNQSLQYIEVNPAMERLLNSSSGLLVGRNNEDLFGPEAVKLVETDRRALVGETVESEDVLWVQGVPYTFLTVKMPLRDDTGSIVGVIGIARDISERARAERELDRNREHLEEIVHDRTVALEKTNVALKALTQKLVETQETERREIARELHDDIGQELTGLKLLLERSYRKAPTELKSSLKGADGLVSGILTKIRDMALNLRPSMLDDLGLLPALLYQFERFTTHTHIEIKFQHIGVEIRFPPEIETAAFRIIQEALTNVARHAKTSEVWITVEKQGEELWLTVTDQGVGFDPEQGLAGGDSTGLKGIRERVSAIGGSFVLESTPGCGSLLKVQLPLWERRLDPTT
jgi:PAS domain S-box-containing protein